jgi:hypothetical protein
VSVVGLSTSAKFDKGVVELASLVINFFSSYNFQTLYNQVCEDTNNFDILTLVDEKWP